MRLDNRLTAALALSLLIHILIVGSPGWRLPFSRQPEAGGVLEAHLAAGPAPLRPPPETASAQPAPPVPSVQPQPRRAPVSPASEPAPPPVEAEPQAEVPAPPAVAPPLPATPAPLPATPAPVDIPWPRQGRIVFAVTRGEGEQGMPLGRSMHSWRHDGIRYRLETVSETTGLVALFRSVRVVQTSEGRVSPAGLQPESFGVERNGIPAEGARFEWTAGKATLLRGGQPRREVTVAAGAQDVLSQIYQIGLAGVVARLELMIATGKHYGRYAYEAVGDEILATRFGPLRTWHVRTPALPGEQAMELWLAQDYRNLPVRIRFIDRKGEVYEQNAIELEVEGALLGAEGE